MCTGLPAVAMSICLNCNRETKEVKSQGNIPISVNICMFFLGTSAYVYGTSNQHYLFTAMQDNSMKIRLKLKTRYGYERE
jgi:hypothetical protein